MKLIQVKPKDINKIDNICQKEKTDKKAYTKIKKLLKSNNY